MDPCNRSHRWLPLAGIQHILVLQLAATQCNPVPQVYRRVPEFPGLSRINMVLNELIKHVRPLAEHGFAVDSIWYVIGRQDGHIAHVALGFRCIFPQRPEEAVCSLRTI